MKPSRLLSALIFAAALLLAARLHGGEVAPQETQRTVLNVNDFEPPRWEFAAESAYLFGIIGNPNDYQIGAQFLTARLRWGVNREDDSIFRGYNQVYLLGMVEPIFRGPENHYFGISMGFRHVFVRPGWRLQPYTSGGVGLGWIDSTDPVFQGQGQDFTFNILTAAGVNYLVNDRFKINVGVLYQHLSNAGQTDPNPSLNLIGPQVGVTFSF